MGTLTNFLKFHRIENRPTFFLIIFGGILFFAFIYLACDWNQKMYDDEENEVDGSKGGKTKFFNYNSIPNGTPVQKIWNKIYLSITTLTTLGFGDIYPIHPISQAAIACQTFLTFMIVTDLI